MNASGNGVYRHTRKRLITKRSNYDRRRDVGDHIFRQTLKCGYNVEGKPNNRIFRCLWNWNTQPQLCNTGSWWTNGLAGRLISNRPKQLYITVHINLVPPKHLGTLIQIIYIIHLQVILANISYVSLTFNLTYPDIRDIYITYMITYMITLRLTSVGEHIYF